MLDKPSPLAAIICPGVNGGAQTAMSYNPPDSNSGSTSKVNFVKYEPTPLIIIGVTFVAAKISKPGVGEI